MLNDLAHVTLVWHMHFLGALLKRFEHRRRHEHIDILAFRLELEFYFGNYWLSSFASELFT